MLPLIVLLLVPPPIPDINALVTLPDGDVITASRAHLTRTRPPPVLPHARWTLALSEVVSVARTPDGRVIVAGTRQGDVLRINARDGRRIGACGRRLRGAAMVAVDAEDVVAVSTMGDLMRCRVDSGEIAPLPIDRLPRLPDGVPRTGGWQDGDSPTLFRRFRHVALGAGDRLVVIGDGYHDGGAVHGAVFSNWRAQASVRLIEPQPHAQWPPLQAQAAPHDPWWVLQTATFSPDGARLALGYQGGAVEVIDLGSTGPIGAAPLWADGSLHRPVHRICWSKATLVVAHWKGIRQMDPQTGAWRGDVNDPQLRAVACGAPVAFADASGLQTVGPWAPSPQPARTAPRDPITCQRPWPKTMALVPQPGDVWLKLNVNSPKVMFLDEGHVLLHGPDRIIKLTLDGRQVWAAPGTGAVTYAAARLDADRLALGDGRGAVAIYRVRDGKRLADLPGRLHGWVHALAVRPDGKELVAGSLKGDLRRWRLPEGTPLPIRVPSRAAPPPQRDAALKVAAKDVFVPPTRITYMTELHFAPDGALLMTGRGGALLFERWPSMASHRALPTGPFVHTGRFSPDGRQIAIGEWGGRLLLMGRDGALIGQQPMPQNWVNDVRWRPDGAGLWAQRPRSLVWMDREGRVTTLRTGPVPAILHGMDLDPRGARLALIPDLGGVVISAATTEPTTPLTAPGPLQQAVSP